MVTKEQIERINELYKKKTEVGLTNEELEEQTILRRLYIDSYKQNLKAQLENIEVATPGKQSPVSGVGHQHSKDCGCENHEHKPKRKLKH